MTITIACDLPRRSAGKNSATQVIVVTMPAARPNPVTTRAANSIGRFCASAVSSDAPAPRVTNSSRPRLRPSRSARAPPRAAPRNMPKNAAEVISATSSIDRPQNLTSPGAAEGNV
jgi:hypothetical protein